MSGVEDANELERTITRLQSIVLSSVLRGEPLPGQSEPVRFADLAYITNAPSVLVSDENIPGELELPDIDKPVEVVAQSRIQEAAVSEGDRAYVRFQPPDQTGGQIRIVMEVRIAPTEPNIHPLGLGAISAKFVRTPDGGWAVSEPPMGLAY